MEGRQREVSAGALSRMSNAWADRMSIRQSHDAGHSKSRRAREREREREIEGESERERERERPALTEGPTGIIWMIFGNF